METRRSPFSILLFVVAVFHCSSIFAVEARDLCKISEEPIVSRKIVPKIYSPGSAQDTIDPAGRIGYDAWVSPFTEVQRLSGALLEPRYQVIVAGRPLFAYCFSQIFRRLENLLPLLTEVDSRDAYSQRQVGLVAAWTMASVGRVFNLRYSEGRRFFDEADQQLGFTVWSKYVALVRRSVLSGPIDVGHQSDWRNVLSNHHVWAIAAIANTPKFLASSIRLSESELALIERFCLSELSGDWPSEAVRGSRSDYYHFFALQGVAVFLGGNIDLGGARRMVVLRALSNVLRRHALDPSFSVRADFSHSEFAALASSVCLLIQVNPDSAAMMPGNLVRVLGPVCPRARVAFSGELIKSIN